MSKPNDSAIGARHAEQVCLSLSLIFIFGLILAWFVPNDYFFGGLLSNTTEGDSINEDCGPTFKSEASINQQFVAISQLIKDDPHSKLISVEVASGCTYRAAIRDTQTNAVTNIFSLPSNQGGVFIAGDMLASNGAPVLFQKSNPNGTPHKPIATSTSASADSPSKKAPQAPDMEPTPLTTSTALKHNPHLEFYGGLGGEKDVITKKRKMLSYAYNLPGATINPSGKLKMVVFYDPFCPHCHDLYERLKTNINFSQRWVPISLGLDKEGPFVGGVIARQAEYDNDKGVAIMDRVMLKNAQRLDLSRLASLAPRERSEMVSNNNTQFILPVLIQEKAGSPYLFIETAKGDIDFFAGVPDLLQVKKWSSDRF
jgi:hypothetical protein